MPAANEREDTFNEETRLRWLGGGDQRVRSSLLVCATIETKSNSNLPKRPKRHVGTADDARAVVPCK